MGICNSENNKKSLLKEKKIEKKGDLKVEETEKKMNSKKKI